MPLPSIYTTPRFLREYMEHQDKFVNVPSERDVAFLEIVKGLQNPSMSLLDMGCNTGNFLRMIQRAFPLASLFGVDIVPGFISKARDLSMHVDFDDIKYAVSDMVRFESPISMDMVVFNASVMCMEDGELVQALMRANENMKNGGSLLIFDYFHPFSQNLEIKESHNSDEILHLRSYDLARNIAKASGFSDVKFIPFFMKNDRPIEEGTALIQSHTRRFIDGENASFRGAIYQPWCFMTARKG